MSTTVNDSTAATTAQSANDTRTTGRSGQNAEGKADTGTGSENNLVAPKVKIRRSQPFWLNVLLRFTGPVAIIIAWSWASASGAVKPQQFPAPWEVVAALADLSSSGKLWENLSVSLQRAAIGLVIGLAIGLAVGVISGLFRLGDQLIDPSVQILRTIPVLALSPLLIIWFGIDELPKITIIAMAAGIPTYINTHLGVRHVDPKLIEAGHAFGLRSWELIRTIVIPEALPQILLGFRIAMTASLGALVVAELSNTRVGLGFLMTSAQQYFQTDIVVACILLYAVAGLLADTIVRVLERVTMPYKFRSVAVTHRNRTLQGTGAHHGAEADRSAGADRKLPSGKAEK